MCGDRGSDPSQYDSMDEAIEAARAVAAQEREDAHVERFVDILMNGNESRYVRDGKPIPLDEEPDGDV